MKNADRKLVMSLAAAFVDTGKFDNHEGNLMIIKEMSVSAVKSC